MTKPRLPFTPAEDDKVRAFHAEGREIPWISNKLRRSRGGIYSRLIYLGLAPKPVKKVSGPRTDLPFVQTRKRDNATADACFRAAMGGRLFSIRATNDAGGIRVRRPERALGGGGSSLSFAAGRTRSEREEAAKP